MNTQQLVALLKEDFAPGYANLKLLSYIERAQNELFNSDCAQLLFYNKNDVSFPVPILVTVNEQLDYTPSASNLVDSAGAAIALTVGGYAVSVRKINKIFIKDSDFSTTYNSRYRGVNYLWSGQNINYNRNYDTTFSEIPAILNEKTNLEDANLIFAENPGASTDKYYIEFYYGAVSLDSESIPLSVDGDKWTEAFIKAVRGYIEESRNGRSELLDGDPRTGSFRRYWIPKFRASLNAGRQHLRPAQFETRECG